MKIVKHGAAFLNAALCRAKISLRASFNDGPKILFYTDSRGCDVSKWYNKRTPARGYIDDLSHIYKVNYKSCPHKHTTLIDALHYLKRSPDAAAADFIVLHVGIVDFSPRPLSDAVKLAEKKRQKLTEIIGPLAARDFELREYTTPYKGERTASLYSPLFFQKHLLPIVASLPSKVIWVGVHPVLNGWSGDYPGRRPDNMNVILDYQKLIDDLPGIMAIAPCRSADEIRLYTSDNVHFNRGGHKLIAKKLIGVISASQVVREN